MTPPYLTQVELAARWRISPRTLERWRWAGEGLPFTKVGGRVLYSLSDIEAYEAAQRRCVTGDGSSHRLGACARPEAEADPPCQSRSVGARRE